jgi:hypothetical protein
MNCVLIPMRSQQPGLEDTKMQILKTRLSLLAPLVCSALAPGGAGVHAAASYHPPRLPQRPNIRILLSRPAKEHIR